MPTLRAYDRNRLRIEQADLPLDVEIGALQHEAVPYYRSGLVVSFPVRAARGALLRLVLEDGKSPPPGAQVRLDGQTEFSPLGLDGEAYVKGITASQNGRAEWNGRHCAFSVQVPDTRDPLSHLGVVPCKEARP